MRVAVGVEAGDVIAVRTTRWQVGDRAAEQRVAMRALRSNLAVAADEAGRRDAVHIEENQKFGAPPRAVRAPRFRACATGRWAAGARQDTTVAWAPQSATVSVTVGSSTATITCCSGD